MWSSPPPFFILFPDTGISPIPLSLSLSLFRRSKLCLPTHLFSFCMYVSERLDIKGLCGKPERKRGPCAPQLAPFRVAAAAAAAAAAVVNKRRHYASTGCGVGGQHPRTRPRQRSLIDNLCTKMT